MRWLTIFFISYFFILFSIAEAKTQTVCTEIKASGNPEYPPYLWRETPQSKHLSGAAVLYMDELSKEIGIPISVNYIGTWARVQEEARTGQIDMIAGAFYTLPRLDYMDYFYPAFQDTVTKIFVRSDSTFPYTSWADLKSKRGVTVINNSFGEQFDNFAKTNLKITQVPKLEQAIQMLQNKRVDYLIYEDAPAEAFLNKVGVSNVISKTPTITSELLFVTLSHKSPCNTPEIRAKISRALFRLHERKAMPGLLKKGIQSWRSQNTPANN